MKRDIKRLQNKGGHLIEVALGLPLALMLIFGLMSFAYVNYERSSLDWNIAHIADTLPANAEANPEAAIRQALTSQGDIKSENLVIKNATITPKVTQQNTRVDSLAKQLGSGVATSRTEDLEIKADLEYKLEPLASFADTILGGIYSRDINQTVTTQRRYEIS